MPSIDEVIGAILYQRDQAEIARTQAYRSHTISQEVQTQIAAIAGESLQNVALEAYNRLGKAAEETNAAAGALTSAIERLETWVAILAQAAG